VSQVERGVVDASLEVLASLSSAVGCQLAVRLYPADGVRLRDSGQLELARFVCAQADPRWRARFEVPIGRPPDRRAGDIVLDQAAEAILLEIETRLSDFQAQLRSAQLKRASLSEHLVSPVRLVIALRDTSGNRRLVAAHSDVVRQALPLNAARVWRSIRGGTPLGGDGLIWLRTRPDARAGKPRVNSVAG